MKWYDEKIWELIFKKKEKCEYSFHNKSKDIKEEKESIVLRNE